MSLNYQATRFRCSWPWETAVLLCDGRVVVDLSSVGYVDSATIGCLMDLYRQMNAAGGAVRLAGVQKRVETMLTMTGALNFLQAHPDEAGALASFGGAA